MWSKMFQTKLVNRCPDLCQSPVHIFTEYNKKEYKKNTVEIQGTAKFLYIHPASITAWHNRGMFCKNVSRTSSDSSCQVFSPSALTALNKLAVSLEVDDHLNSRAI